MGGVLSEKLKDMLVEKNRKRVARAVTDGVATKNLEFCINTSQWQEPHFWGIKPRPGRGLELRPLAHTTVVTEDTYLVSSI